MNPNPTAHLFFLKLAFALVFLVQISSSHSAEKNPTLESAHILITWNKEQTSRVEAVAVLEKAAPFFEEISRFFGDTFAPQTKIVISLEGDSQNPDGNRRRPYVDTDQGWLHLYRFSEDSFAYQTGLSHELVHAFRFAHLKRYGSEPPSAFTFLEEGLAEYISTLIEPRKSVFPSYGYELDVTAGQWLTNSKELPLSILIRSEAELGQRCFAQAYTERPSFIQYLDERFGRSALTKIVYAEDIRSEESFKRYFGKDFAGLSADWKSWALKRYLAKDPEKTIGPRWRTTTKIAQMYICKRGADW